MTKMADKNHHNDQPIRQPSEDRDGNQSYQERDYLVTSDDAEKLRFGTLKRRRTRCAPEVSQPALSLAKFRA
jgi:hypothetical protein